MSFFKKRNKPKSRGLISGDTDCGKTYLMAQMAKSKLFGPICIIDTEDGAKYEEGSLPKGSEVVLVRSNVEALAVLRKLAATGAEIPFNTIIVDSMTTVWQRFTTAYGVVKGKKDAITAKKYNRDPSIRTDIDMYEKTRRMGLNDWGNVKEKHSKLVRLLFDLPCHIMVTAHLKLIFNDKNEPIGEIPKVEKNLPYMMDYSLIMRKTGPSKRIFEVIKDRSKVVKKNQLANLETLEKIALAIPGVEITEITSMSSGGDFKVSEDDTLQCDECGTETDINTLNKVSAKCGDMICWACYRERQKDNDED